MFSVKFYSTAYMMPHAYAARERYRLFIGIFIAIFNKIALFFAISDFVLLLLFADKSCLIQWRYIKLLFQGGDIGREVMVEKLVEVFHIPS